MTEPRRDTYCVDALGVTRHEVSRDEALRCPWMIVVPCPEHDTPGHMFAGQPVPEPARFGADDPDA